MAMAMAMAPPRFALEYTPQPQFTTMASQAAQWNNNNNNRSHQEAPPDIEGASVMENREVLGLREMHRFS